MPGSSYQVLKTAPLCSTASRDGKTAPLQANLDSKAAVIIKHIEAAVCFMKGRLRLEPGLLEGWAAASKALQRNANNMVLAGGSPVHTKSSRHLSSSTMLPSRKRLSFLMPLLSLFLLLRKFSRHCASKQEHRAKKRKEQTFTKAETMTELVYGLHLS